MADLDAVHWEAGWAFTSFGACIGVRANSATIVPQLAAQLPPEWEPTASPLVDELYSVLLAEMPNSQADGLHRMFRGPDEIARSPDIGTIVDRFSSDLHHQVALLATDLLFVHAGVVAGSDGVIVLPGRSHSGKSSLVAALIRAGALYYSDEYAVFDRQAQVHPYAKRISIRREEGLRQFRTAESLGGHSGNDPLPMKVLAVTRYEPGAVWDPDPLSPGQAVLALFDNTVLARSQPESALAIFGRAIAGAVAVTSVRGEAQETAQHLLNLLT